MENEDQVCKNFGPYEMLEMIGAGAHSKVWKAKHVSTGLFVAVKVIQKSKLTNTMSIVRFGREIQSLQEIDHPLVAKYYFLHEDEHNHYIVMEYVPNGTLLGHINNRGKVFESLAKRYFVQIMTVIDYLHNERKIFHRDIKAENILLDSHFNIRFVDFGLSRSFDSEEDGFTSVCGSPCYVSPEMIEGKGYTIASDIWSAGILLFSLVYGKLPFHDPNTTTMLQMICKADLQIPYDPFGPLADLISKMLVKNPKDRITLNGIKNHQWLAKGELHNMIAHTKSIVDTNMNSEIIQQMANYGHIGFIPNEEMDDPNALFKILQREKITELIQTTSRVKDTNRTPEPIMKIIPQVMTQQGINQGKSRQPMVKVPKETVSVKLDPTYPRPKLSHSFMGQRSSSSNNIMKTDFNIF